MRTIENSFQLLKEFKTYVAYRGYTPIKVYHNEWGLLAQIKEFKYKSDGFTQVLQGGTVVRLSFADWNNKAIVGDYKFSKPIIN